EEWREQEPAADGEREPSARTAPPGSFDPEDEDARTELSRHLRPSVFPAGRDQLLGEARENCAPEAVLALLARLPDGREFGTVYARPHKTGVAGRAVQMVAVPQLVGLTRDAALIQVGRAGLKPKIQVRTTGARDGLVVEQRPAQTEKVAHGSPVLILVDRAQA